MGNKEIRGDDNEVTVRLKNRKMPKEKNIGNIECERVEQRTE